MKIESTKVNVSKSAEYIFNSLTDIKNFEQIMPESIAKFEVIDQDTFLFALSGMPEIKLRKKELTPFSKITLGAASDKLPFTLISNIKSIDDNNSEIQLFFEGEFNPMIEMMIKGTIGKFVESLANNMKKL